MKLSSEVKVKDETRSVGRIDVLDVLDTDGWRVNML